MQSVIECQEQRRRVYERMAGLHNGAERRNVGLTRQQEREWDQLDAEFRTLTDQIDLLKSKEKRFQREPLETGALSQGDDDFVSFVRGDGRRSFDVGIETRDLTTSTSGAPIPTSFLRQLREHVIASSAIRQTNVTVLNTESGEDLQVPKTTTHPTAALTAEGAPISESDPVFDMVTLESFKYAWLGQLTTEFVQDEAVNVLDYLARTGRTGHRERQRDALCHRDGHGAAPGCGDCGHGRQSRGHRPDHNRYH